MSRIIFNRSSSFEYSNSKDLIKKLICKPEKRLTANEALQHKWMKKMNAAGSMINLAGTFLIGSDLLHEVNCRHEERNKIKEAKAEKDLTTYNSNLASLKQLKREKPDESSWKVDELKIGLRVAKKFGDRANPQNKAGLVTLWEEYRPQVASEIEELGESEATLSANQARPVINQTVDVVTGSAHDNEGHNEGGRTVM